MTKFNAFFLALVALSGSVFTGCNQKKDIVPATVVTQDNNIPNGTVQFSLSVQVIPSSVSTTAKSAGLTGATVTISQNGSTQTATTNSAGLATFGGLSEGDVAVYIANSGYLSYNTTTTLVRSYNTSSSNQVDANQVQFKNLSVTLPKLGASVKGKIYGDFTYSGTNTLIPSGVTVYAKTDNSYEPNVFTTTTDANGQFAFTNLPETVSLDFSINYTTTDNTVSPSQGHTWYLNGVNGINAEVYNAIDLGNINAYNY